jgi:hypothetical protein
LPENLIKVTHRAELGIRCGCRRLPLPSSHIRGA